MSYGDREFWEARYGGDGPDEPEEWLQTFAVLRPSLEEAVRRDRPVLMVGCGTSRLDEEMHAAGWTRIVSMDYARAALAGRSPRDGLRYLAMDVRRMALRSGSFAAVVDKGTLDALACVNDDGEALAEACREVARVIEPGGRLYSVSFSAPDLRQPIFEAAMGAAGKSFTIPKKRLPPGMDPALLVNWVYVVPRAA